MSRNIGSLQLVELPIKTRRTLIALFFFGLVLIFSASMVNPEVDYFSKDKLIHLTAYTFLATILTLSFSIRNTLIGLVFLVCTSYLIEYIQPWNDRTSDVFDALSNTAGVCIGSGVGFGLRLAAHYFLSDWQEMRMKRYLKIYRAGDIILRSGQQTSHFYIVKRGMVEMFRNEKGFLVPMGKLGKGGVFGLVSDALGTRQDMTIIAKLDCLVYKMDYESLIIESGGKNQPVAVLLKKLIKQYDSHVDYLVDELMEYRIPVSSNTDRS